MQDIHNVTSAFAEAARIAASYFMKENAIALETFQDESKRQNDFLNSVLATADPKTKSDKTSAYLAEAVQRSTKSIATAIERGVNAGAEMNAAFQAIKA